MTYSEGSGDIWRNISDEGHPSSPILNEDGSLTYSGVYTVGDLLYGQSGRTTVNEVVRNTAPNSLTTISVSTLTLPIGRALMT